MQFTRVFENVRGAAAGGGFEAFDKDIARKVHRAGGGRGGARVPRRRDRGGRGERGQRGGGSGDDPQALAQHWSCPRSRAGAAAFAAICLPDHGKDRVNAVGGGAGSKKLCAGLLTVPIVCHRGAAPKRKRGCSSVG